MKFGVSSSRPLQALKFYTNLKFYIEILKYFNFHVECQHFPCQERIS